MLDKRQQTAALVSSLALIHGAEQRRDAGDAISVSIRAAFGETPTHKYCIS